MANGYLEEYIDNLGCIQFTFSISSISVKCCLWLCNLLAWQELSGCGTILQLKGHLIWQNLSWRNKPVSWEMLVFTVPGNCEVHSILSDLGCQQNSRQFPPGHQTACGTENLILMGRGWSTRYQSKSNIQREMLRSGSSCRDRRGWFVALSASAWQWPFSVLSALSTSPLLCTCLPRERCSLACWRSQEFAQPSVNLKQTNVSMTNRKLKAVNKVFRNCM